MAMLLSLSRVTSANIHATIHSSSQTKQKQGGWGNFNMANIQTIGASIQTFGKSMEEKMQTNSAIYKEQEKLNASKHGLGVVYIV
jgi:hypothetical protein